MQKNIFLAIGVLCCTMFSCQNTDKKETAEKEKDATAVVIDSSAFKVKKEEVKIKTMEKPAPSSAEEVEKLLDSKDVSTLNEYQKIAQQFIVACGKKDYEKVANYLAYNASDAQRRNKDHYNIANQQEFSIVKTTADVVFGFLSESKDFQVMSYKTQDTKNGKIHAVEILFYEKGIGMNRRFFEMIDTPKGVLIYNMY